jgi:hypothetical protein
MQTDTGILGPTTVASKRGFRRSVAAIALLSLLQVAAVTQLEADHPSGATWFVGKGDVQSAFGWSAKETDSRIDEVVFTYIREETREFDCVANNGENGVRRVSTVVDTTVTREATTRSTAVETRTTGKRTASSVTGVWVTLTGTPSRLTTEVPCPSEWTDADGEIGAAGAVYAVAKSQSSGTRTTHEQLIAHSGGGRKASSAVIWTS